MPHSTNVKKKNKGNFCTIYITTMKFSLKIALDLNNYNLVNLPTVFHSEIWCGWTLCTQANSSDILFIMKALSNKTSKTSRKFQK